MLTQTGDDVGQEGVIGQVARGQAREDRLAGGVELTGRQGLAQEQHRHGVHALTQVGYRGSCRWWQSRS